MSILQQVTRPVLESESKTWQRQIFRSDDDQFIPISIWLESNQAGSELIDDITLLLQAYGFAIREPINRAPGSIFFSFRSKSEKNREEASKDRRALEQDLLNKILPNIPTRQRAVSKFKKNVRRRAKHGIFILIGSVCLCSVEKFGDGFLDGAGKKAGEYTMERIFNKSSHDITPSSKASKAKPHHKKQTSAPAHASPQPVIIINLNTEGAASCHQVFQEYIGNSSDKTIIPAPQSSEAKERKINRTPDEP